MSDTSSRKPENNSQKPGKWLLKEGTHITGPFTEKEIHKMIEDGNISYATAMACVVNQGFWISLSYYSEFAMWADKLSINTITDHSLSETTTNQTFIDTQNANTKKRGTLLLPVLIIKRYLCLTNQRMNKTF